MTYVDINRFVRNRVVVHKSISLSLYIKLKLCKTIVSCVYNYLRVYVTILSIRVLFKRFPNIIMGEIHILIWRPISVYPEQFW